MPEDLYVLAVYVCPDNSSSGRAGDIFQFIESDIASYSKTGKCVVFSDFNGRTASESDYCMNDETLSKFIVNEGLCLIDNSLPRNNSDIQPVDKNGRQLLDLCISSGLRIINGRLMGDNSGYHTCFFQQWPTKCYRTQVLSHPVSLSKKNVFPPY